MKSRSNKVVAQRPRRVAECYVAACSGTARLTGEIGFPVVHVGVSCDAQKAIAKLNIKQHGSGTLWPGSFQPLEPQPGWADWGLFQLEAGVETGFPPPCGAVIQDGVIRLPLPSGVTLTELREQLSGALSRLRFQDFVRQPRWLEAQSASDPFAKIVVHPRYILRGNSFRGARLVTDLVVLDPSQDAARLLWIVVGACLAACDGRLPRWK
ncbi:hypothetical protein [Beijerinckia sp. L45]|uniref:hypothetical protein n=1 Tax=Beijerinckia sp. L45 TaxID=1641855 RepID=UPI00131B7790|nr:hypothetical protein [Beijerinckia sp. L45]